MTEHLPVLQVLVPLLAAPLCVLLHGGRAAWAVFMAASLASLACSWMMLQAVLVGGPISYELGGWAPPAGIEYLIDAANAYILLLVSLISTIVAVYAPASIESEISPRRVYLYYSCLCLCLAGLLGMVATGDAFNVFVFLEISSLATYVLIAMGRRRSALLAAFQYLILGTIGATFFLIGIGLMYSMTGSLNMADLAVRLEPWHESRTLVAAVAFVGIGIALKMALFPLHAWLPGAYAEAPSAASAFLAATGTKVAIYAFLRFAFTVFGAALVFEALPGREVLLFLGTFAMLAASAVACLQADFKRILAWSSVAQIGYIVVGFSLASIAGLTAAHLHIFNHAIIKCALFCAAGIVMLRIGGTGLDRFAGLARRMPYTFAALLLSGLGLIGVPGTAGFVSKWALIQSLVEAQAWAVVVAVLFSSLLAVVYIGKVVEIAWFRDPPDDQPVEPVPGSMAAALWILVALNIVLGLNSGELGDYATAAAQALLRVSL